MNPLFMNAIANKENPTTNAMSATAHRRPVKSAAMAQNVGNRTMQNLGADRRGRAGRGYERMTRRLATTYTRYGGARSFHRSASDISTSAGRSKIPTLRVAEETTPAAPAAPH